MLIAFSDKFKLWRRAVIPLRLGSSFEEARRRMRDSLATPYVCIKDTWYRTLSVSELFRARNVKTGYWHCLYVQIYMDTGEYYVGKVNRRSWRELSRYQGSGLRFQKSFSRHIGSFVRFHFCPCATARETEVLEALIVDKELISDPLCLNLVSGGGGAPSSLNTPYGFERRSLAAKRRMLASPGSYARFRAMALKLFSSGDTPALSERSARIKEVMSDDKYRAMTRDRIRKWRADHPEEYAAALEKSANIIKSDSYRQRRRKIAAEMKTRDPDVWRERMDRFRQAGQTDAAKAKRRESLRRLKELHPEIARENARKRAVAASAKHSKPVDMYDLNTGETLRRFAPSPLP